MNQKIIMDVHEKPKILSWLALSMQHLFAMFGATILVPVLTGLDPAVTLLTSGLGTVAYLIVTQGKIPAYLGSSFAFIVPIITVSQTEGIGAALFGCISFRIGVWGCRPPYLPLWCKLAQSSPTSCCHRPSGHRHWFGIGGCGD